MAFEDCYAEVLSSSVVSGEYDESNDSYLKVLQALLPPGIAWTFDVASNMAGLLEGLSYSFLRVAGRTQDMLKEFDPRTTTELIDDHERVFDLPGTNPTPPTSIADRRAALHGKMLGNGDPAISFFEDLALGAGYAIHVRQNDLHGMPFIATSNCNDPLANETFRFWWEVVYTTGAQDDTLEWLIESLAPEHTRVTFANAGSTWVEQTNPKNFVLYGVAHDKSGLWTAVGNADGVDAYLITSPNGEDFTERTNPANVTLYGIGHGSSQWAACGATSGGDAYLITSPDGDAWTEQTTPVNVPLFDADRYNGRWIVVGNSTGAQPSVLMSSDGVTWTLQTISTDGDLRAVKHNGVDRWCAVGLSGYILTSDDGFEWTQQTAPATHLYGVDYNPSAKMWVAVGAAGLILTSTDNGETWHTQTNPSAAQLESVSWAGWGWVAVGATAGGDAAVVTSINGVDWTERGNPKNFKLWGVSSFNGRSVAVGAADGVDAYLVTTGV